MERPVPSFTAWVDPPSFREALVLHLRRFSESYYQLHRSIIRPGEKLDRATLQSWVEGRRSPRSAASLEILARIERRYDLPLGYFKAKLPNPARAPSGLMVKDMPRAEQRRLAWHLPDDFNSRPLKEQSKILDWVQNVVISGATEYRRFQAQAMKLRYAIRFPSLTGTKRTAWLPSEDACDFDDQADHVGIVDAPPRLVSELTELVRFKTATLTDIGFVDCC
ncbi:hypothetical protein [Sphingobium sp. YBL2]|uniref:hypothetical protein n=1 Tax=Sphingobium sp. (strain YBL2) TaxID=484429 RepID=UPI001EE3308C|nr:hypothetical protein [Sphingobium sp. YBL2]